MVHVFLTFYLAMYLEDPNTVTEKLYDVEAVR